ncbi:hypothetical protein F7725_026347 [Dissostichus mawsoni]|uniref:LIM zinc-binding domain-containing protein n=1 Tax=Dissostichus mawsoni TaxID=36200 RepID=A0A7J5X6T1_DISMA|nr:hypothetical protein F7725_026347 [Dissostichus mawsoni]
MLSVQPKGKQKGCAGCNRKIKDRYLLKALDKYWHEDCLKCACCDCRLGEVGSTLYTKANLILCSLVQRGIAQPAVKLIPAFEMVMRARDNVYHLDCFACQLCNQRVSQSDYACRHKTPLCLMPTEIVLVFLTTVPPLCFSTNRFCVGDKFFLKNNMILCQMDYEEGQLNGSFDTQVQ